MSSRVNVVVIKLPFYDCVFAKRYLLVLWLRAISERVVCALTAHGLPLSLVFAFNGSSGTSVRLSLCSRLCLTCVDDGATLVVGRRTPLAARDSSSAVSSTTSARNRHRRARMNYRDQSWSPNRHTTLTFRSDRGRRFRVRCSHSQTFISDLRTRWT